MLCEKCKTNEATYHYHENVNGAEKTYHLCRTCRDELEKSGEIGGSDLGMHPLFDTFFADPFKGTLFSSLFAPVQSRIPTTEKKCTCGMTLREFSRTGMAGCPECYETFGRELAQSITGIRGTHTGRIPSKMREKQSVKQRIEELERERAEAVKSENYERAAELRDELRQLRGE